MQTNKQNINISENYFNNLKTKFIWLKKTLFKQLKYHTLQVNTEYIKQHFIYIFVNNPLLENCCKLVV